MAKFSDRNIVFNQAQSGINISGVHTSRGNSGAYISIQLVSLYSQSYSVKLLESAFEEILSFGRSCLKNNKPYKAIKYLEYAININPMHAPSYHELGRACLVSGQFYKAIEYLQMSLRFIDYAHNAESVHNDLQIAYEKVGHPLARSTLLVIEGYLKGKITIDEFNKYFQNKYGVSDTLYENSRLVSVPVINNLQTHLIDRSDLVVAGIPTIDPVITSAFKSWYTLSINVKGYSTKLAIAFQKVLELDSSGLIKMLLKMQPYLGVVFIDHKPVYDHLLNPVGGFAREGMFIVKASGVLDTVAFIIHELTHLSVKKLFGDYEPYFKDSQAGVEYNHIIQNDLLQHRLMRMQDPFGGVYTPEEYPAEVIAFFMEGLTRQLYQDISGRHNSKAVIFDGSSFINSSKLWYWVLKHFKPVLKTFTENPELFYRDNYLEEALEISQKAAAEKAMIVREDSGYLWPAMNLSEDFGYSVALDGDGSLVVEV
jgi:tetratricopeptide (TPR) repeat protein